MHQTRQDFWPKGFGPRAHRMTPVARALPLGNTAAATKHIVKFLQPNAIWLASQYSRRNRLLPFGFLLICFCIDLVGSRCAFAEEIRNNFTDSDSFTTAVITLPGVPEIN